MAERSFDVVVIGAGPAGEVAAGRLGEAASTVAHRRAAPRRRRVLVLRVHAVEGAAAAGRGARRGAARPRRREAVTGELDVPRRARAARRGHPRPRRLRAAAVARGARRRRWCAGAAGSTASGASTSADDALVGAAGGRRRDRQRPRDAADPGPGGGAPWTNREATTAKEVARAPGRPRRRRRRRRAGAGVGVARHARDDRRGRATG